MKAVFTTHLGWFWISIIASIPLLANDSDWPQWGGTTGSLRSEAGLEFSDTGSVSLELVWKKKFGSGYTSIITAGKVGICAASTSEGDILECFELKSGKKLWQYRLADVFHGRSGSDDGPVSTPIIENGVVYMLHPGGTVAALRLKNGEEIWRRQLVDQDGAIYPEYGFSTSPVIVGNIIVLPLNDAKPTTLIGLNKTTGKREWTSGSSKLGYQNPVVIGKPGKQVIVFPANSAIYGLSPKTGAILWELPLERPESSSLIAPVDANRFLIKSGRKGQMVEIKDDGDGPQAKVLWQKNIFKSNHCQPIYYDHHFYGFDSRFLACFRAEDGELVWKSRPPGGQTIAMVDDLLLMWDAKGALAVVEATPAGYREKGRLALSSQVRIFTPPTYADGLIFLRDLENLFAVRMTESNTRVAVVEKKAEVDDAFTQFVDRLAKAPDAQPLLTKFLQDHPQAPIVTDKGWVHFYFIGDAQDLAIQGDMTGFWPEVPMNRVANTNFYHRSYPIDKNQRWQYRFKQFEESVLDPRNPNKLTTTNGDFNTVIRGNWQEPTYLTALSTGTKGTVTDVKVPNPQGEEDFQLSVYLPSDYAASPDKRYPLLVFAQGEQAQKFGSMVPSLDNLTHHLIQPTIAIFLKLPRNIWWDRATEKFQEVMETNIMPYLESHYRIQSDPASRTFVSREWSTKNALIYVFKHKSRFGNIALQSPLFGATFIERELPTLMPQHPQLKVYLDWAQYGGYNPAWPANIPESTPQLAKVLRQAGHPVQTAIRPGGFGWVSWRTHTGKMLETFLSTR